MGALSLFLTAATVAPLIAAAVTKLAAPRAAIEGIGNLGFRTPRTRAMAWAAAIVLEAGASAAALAMPEAGLPACALLYLVFAGLMLRARLGGREGFSCGCFGSKGTISGRAVGINLGLAATAALATLTEVDGISVSALLAVGLVMSLAASAGLAVAVFSLAREVGVLKIAMSSGGALEIAGEGPEVGSRHSLSVESRPGAELVLAVFTSAGCPMCRNLGPALDLLRRDDRLEVHQFDEEHDRREWESFDVPGSPYAVALTAEGVVLSKGTFNGLQQLESVVVTAARRREEIEIAQ